MGSTLSSTGTSTTTTRYGHEPGPGYIKAFPASILSAMEPGFSSLFQQLPTDLQSIIFRKARFIEAQSRLQYAFASIASRTKVTVKGRCFLRETSLSVNANKAIYIEQANPCIVHGTPRVDDTIVDVCDYSRVAAFVFMDECHDQQVAFDIGVEWSTRHVLTEIEGLAQPPRDPIVQWFCRDRRDPDWGP
jgi:hypothetical protein